MRKFTAVFAALAALFTVSSVQAADLGVWTGPKDNVRVAIRSCGASMCGTVVYASPKAEADARKSGLTTLVGQQLLRDFEPTGHGGMRGKVYVPTLKVTLNGAADFIDARTMRAKGCVLGGLICKAQVWHRIDAVTAKNDTTAPLAP